MRPHRVLIVDDHEPIRRLVEMVLGRSNFKIFHASTGQDALSQVRQERPDLLILDIGLPGESGIEVCRAIKADPQMSHAKVVFLTAHGDRERQAREAGGDAFLTKPFSPVQILATVKAVLSVPR